ncbi:major facilitator superfamily domain-containing protein 2B [Myotis lucifugus]|uniref:major facilitator superfamily domain-containing protein 2B n=1 Tax=Myotis lucifugus TaxID=59463 RepID=UPI000CCC3816|nr:major facilitator superfamily domain-containing protein 2B [Myotis lucifugus]
MSSIALGTGDMVVNRSSLRELAEWTLHSGASQVPRSPSWWVGRPGHLSDSASPWLSPPLSLQIPAAQVSLVMFGGRVSGAAADPVAGFFISRSRRTGSGRLMPWVLDGGMAPPSTRVLARVTAPVLLRAPQFFQVPYTALTMLLTPSPRERDSATAYRMTMEMAGTLLGAAAHGLIVSGAHGPHSCEDAEFPGPGTVSPHAVMVPFVILLAAVPTAPVAYIVAFVSGVSIALSLLLPWSMLPDVVDDFQLQHQHGPGIETIFYSSYVFFTKLSGAGALGISTLSLEFAGYEAGACKQAEQVVVTLKVLIGAVPTCMILTGLCILMVGPGPKVPSQDSSHQLSLRRRTSYSLAAS